MVQSSQELFWSVEYGIAIVTAAAAVHGVLHRCAAGANRVTLRFSLIRGHDDDGGGSARCTAWQRGRTGRVVLQIAHAYRPQWPRSKRRGDERSLIFEEASRCNCLTSATVATAVEETQWQKRSPVF